MQIDGLILAGGKSSRMGGNHKGNLIYGNETFVEKILNELKKETRQIWISYGEDVHNSYQGCGVVMDEYPGCGPISGLHAGLKKCSGDVVLVAACDMPFLKIKLYQMLLKFLDNQYQGVVPIVDGKMHPLAAVYKPEIVGILENELKAGNYKLGRVWKKMNIRYVDMSSEEEYWRMLTNINTIEDYIKMSTITK